MELYKRLLNKRLIFQLVLLFFGLLLSTFLETLSFGSVIVFIGIITDPQIILNKVNLSLIEENILEFEKSELILISSFFLFIMFLIRNTFLGFINYFSRKFIFNIVTLNSEKLFSYYLASPLKFHYEKKPEVITRNVEQLLFAVCERLFYFSMILREILMMAVIMIVILIFNTFISTVSFFILMFVSYLFIRSLRQSLKRRSLKAHKFDVARLKIINEFYYNLKEIKLYNLHNTVSENFSKALRGVESHRVFFNTVNMLPRLFLEIIAITGILFLTIFSTFYGTDNENLIATITIVAICATRLIPGFQQISTALNVLNNTKFAIDIIKEDIINFDIKSNNFKMSETKTYSFNVLELKDVSFSYLSKQNVLKNINLKINKSDKICIVGESGSGKTTLLSILMGLLDISEGKFFINNREINQKDILNFHSKIAYVAQDVFIADDSIKNNIAIGKLDHEIDIDKLNKIIKLSKLDKLIDESEYGLDSIVGTKGAKLSGGQIQRIGIARALYRDPEIIFFDEATSSLDQDNETLIMNNIFNVFSKSTIIFVTHKKELMKYFDKVITIQSGRISE